MKLLTLTFLIAFITHIVTAEEPACDARKAQTPLIGALRVMNTAQVRFFQQNKRFGGANELLAFPETKRLSGRKNYSQPTADSIAIADSTDPLPGYALRITVSLDGKAYSIIATKKDGACRAYGAATDDRGVIYFIEPLQPSDVK
jgi:hypothetical protein